MTELTQIKEQYVQMAGEDHRKREEERRRREEELQRLIVNSSPQSYSLAPNLEQVLGSQYSNKDTHVETPRYSHPLTPSEAEAAPEYSDNNELLKLAYEKFQSSEAGQYFKQKHGEEGSFDKYVSKAFEEHEQNAIAGADYDNDALIWNEAYIELLDKYVNNEGGEQLDAVVEEIMMHESTHNLPDQQYNLNKDAEINTYTKVANDLEVLADRTGNPLYKQMAERSRTVANYLTENGADSYNSLLASDSLESLTTSYQTPELVTNTQSSPAYQQASAGLDYAN